MLNSMVWLVAVPLCGALLAVLIPRRAPIVGMLATAISLVFSIHILYSIYHFGPFRYALSGWESGLAISLFVDGLSAIMLVMTALVAFAISIYATTYFHDEEQKRFYWPLWLLLLCAINALYLSADLFNLYVTLELLGLSAVALTALNGQPDALRAAARYLVLGLVGSLAFLAGVVLTYIAYGTLDIAVLLERIDQSFYAATIAGLMSIGLIIKTALFPMHFWLPQAHANAPAAVSAALSALVIKAAFYLMLRLWLDLFSGFSHMGISHLFITLGAFAVLWGGWNALQAQRLKLLAAYSSIAQMGFLFMALGMVLSIPEGEARELLIGAMVILAITHGFAKSALFLGAGIIQQKAGHDRIDELDGTAQKLPLTTFALTFAGVALIGLPPSGAFLGKWYLFSSVIQQGLWLWVVVILLGSLLSAAYVFRLMGHLFGQVDRPKRILTIAREEVPALLLALTATLLLAFSADPLWSILSHASVVTGVQ